MLSSCKERGGIVYRNTFSPIACEVVNSSFSPLTGSVTTCAHWTTVMSTLDGYDTEWIAWIHRLSRPVWAFCGKHWITWSRHLHATSVGCWWYRYFSAAAISEQRPVWPASVRGRQTGFFTSCVPQKALGSSVSTHRCQWWLYPPSFTWTLLSCGVGWCCCWRGSMGSITNLSLGDLEWENDGLLSTSAQWRLRPGHWCRSWERSSLISSVAIFPWVSLYCACRVHFARSRNLTKLENFLYSLELLYDL
jgi:hypothetical protein